MGPHSHKKISTCHFANQWKAGEGEGGEKLLNTLHAILLLPTTPIDKLYHPKHVEIIQHMHKYTKTTDNNYWLQ